MGTTATLFVIFLLFNVVTFCLYWWDKEEERGGHWRVSQARLLQVPCLGGNVGAVAAQRLLRHKTRKEPFRTQLMAILVLHAALVPAALIFGPTLLDMLRAG